MAGGSGTRLWPLSRRRRPKQLLRLLDGRSLLEAAFSRLRELLPAEDIYVIALIDHIPAIAAALPDLPPENLIGEPEGRDTANAIALAAALLHKQDPDTLMGVFTADHLIRPTDKFVETVRRGFDVAQREADALITFGIKPSSAHTGLGYIECAKMIHPGFFAVRSFKEKPDLATAQRYISSGQYYWNSGMFVWRTATILDEIRKHLPETQHAVERLAAVWSTPDGPRLAREDYPRLQKISIDFAVMEKAPRVLVLEMDLEWIDLGSWAAVGGAIGADRAGNTQTAPQVATLDAHRNILVSEDDHLIAAVGVEDLVIVHSPDATLVCRRDQIERIKDLVAQLQQRHGEKYS